MPCHGRRHPLNLTVLVTPRVWIKIKLGHISGIILLNELIDLDSLLVIQLRELARVLAVLGSEGGLEDE